MKQHHTDNVEVIDGRRPRGRPRTRGNEAWINAHREQVRADYYGDHLRSWADATIGQHRKLAKARGQPFELTMEDLIEAFTLQPYCPETGIRLCVERGRGRSHDDSTCLRLVDPDLGYVPGNFVLVSWRAKTFGQKPRAPNTVHILMAQLRERVKGLDSVNRQIAEMQKALDDLYEEQARYEDLLDDTFKQMTEAAKR